MKLKNIIIVLALATAFTSCEEQLDLAPLSAVGDNGFYTSADEVEGAVIAIYDGLQTLPLREFALTEMRSDNAKSKSREGDWAQFEANTVAPTNQAVGQYWAANYNVIFRANVVLENLDSVSVDADRKQFEGEAKFARALAHFNLVRAFGDVPIIDQVIIQTDEDYFDRDAAASVLAFIDADLASAASLLPESNEFGRATSGAANGLLGKVRLTAGDHAGAASVLAPLVNGSTYSLMSDYSDVFYQEGNNEILFAIPYVNDDVNESQDFSYEMTAFGVRAGLNYLTDDFKNSMSPDDTLRAPVIVSSNNANETGKYLTTSADVRRCGNDWIVLRHADVLLMYAEAVMGTSTQTADANAIAAYNAVRKRAGQSEVTGGDALTKEALADERRFELAFENHRLYDLIRFGNATSVLAAHAAATGNAFEPTDLLLPIPQAEINISAGKLTQNPGY
ncbi:MAG: RagB/SusD family nutrient uptake outer membrane protein [Bacteroidetes bacterium]|jgi:starch-binding outer membrane protein, SusD/RagB family|nr:RagB/SusD family nutrient uptake outer membrane protein [Bacteroidota bacterium]